jgi:hypothetical protein
MPAAPRLSSASASGTGEVRHERSATGWTGGMTSRDLAPSWSRLLIAALALWLARVSVRLALTLTSIGDGCSRFARGVLTRR